MARNLLIILRTCSRVNMLNGENQGGRYIKVPKHELINVCMSSLITSINQVKNHSIHLVVLDDHSSESAREDFRKILKHCRFPYEFVEITGGTGASYTCSEVYKQVEEKCQDLWYHVEDDYLHFPSAIQDMIDSLDQFESNTGQMIAINPHDDIWRYTRQIYHSVLLLGPYRHYRTVLHSTYTCMATKAIYDRYRNHFQDAARWILIKDENETINQVWNKPDVMLFSPIPSLAQHIMTQDGKDPYIDIDHLWNSVPKLWIQESENKKFAIASIFNDSHQALAAYTWENKKEYAAHHGYLTLAKTDNFSQEQVHFDKFLHILDIMNTQPGIDWIWYIDNDAMITNFDVKLSDLVDDQAHVIMGVDIASLNTGSFLVKNSHQARSWLEFLLSKKKEYRNDKKWFEQQAVIDFYPKFQHLFKVVPQKTLNSYDYTIYNVDSTDLLGHSGQWSKGDFVIHWPGLDNQIRIALAKKYQAEIVRSK
jgi:hypothetical protein